MNLTKREDRAAFCLETLIPFIQSVAAKYPAVDHSVKSKGQGNFVTDADEGIEHDLIEGLSQLLPGAGFLSEERGAAWNSDFDYNWIIDPIDGTTNFIYGLPYAISVALSYQRPENIILGVVYAPRDHRTYYGCLDCGSCVMEGGASRQLQVNRFAPKEGIAIFGTPYNRAKTDRIFALAKRIFEDCADLKRIGPASLDICLVASGVAKVYFELDLQLWDIAAGILILSEAGGHFLQKDDLCVFSADPQLPPFAALDET